jgi:hypothetical protein
VTEASAADSVVGWVEEDDGQVSECGDAGGR